MKSFSKHLSWGIFLFLFAATFSVYWGTWHGYFQQDEWSGFARVMVAQENGLDSLIRFSGFHFTPFSISLVALLYWFFGVNHIPYGIYSVFLHALNVCGVYILAHIVSKSRLTALLSAMIFACVYTPHQAVTWYAASMSVLPGVFLGLVGLILFELYLVKHKTALLTGALISVFFSLGFRENTVILLPYFLLRAGRLLPPVIATGLLYLGIRFLPLLFTSRLTTAAPHISSFALTDILYQLATFLSLHLPRLFIPIQIPLAIGRAILGQEYRLAYDAILPLFYIMLWTGIILWMRTQKKARLVRDLSIFVVLSILPLTLIPPPHIMESRHFYLTAVGFSILAGYFFSTNIRKKAAVIALCFLVGANTFFIRQEIGAIRKISETRLSLLSGWFSLYPTIPEKTIFLSVGDTLPFQSGFGQMLLVLYGVTPLLGDYFLFDISQEGYKEQSDRGFGYFTDIQMLKEAYCAHTLTPTNVFAFSWDGTADQLTDESSRYRTVLICPKK